MAVARYQEVPVPAARDSGYFGMKLRKFAGSERAVPPNGQQPPLNLKTPTQFQTQQSR